MELTLPRERYDVPSLHLRLDRLRSADLGELWRAIELDREQLEQFQRALPASETELVDFCEQAERGWESHYQHRFVLRRANRLVGLCGFADVLLDPSIGQVEVWLAEHARGEGIATEALGVLAEAAFSELGLQRVELLPALDNVAARRLAERVGFTLEGIRRRGLRLASGELADEAIYGLLSTDTRPT